MEIARFNDIVFRPLKEKNAIKFVKSTALSTWNYLIIIDVRAVL